MYQSAENTNTLLSEWKIFEGQQPFPEWHYVQPDALSPGNLEWPSTYLTQESLHRSSSERSTENKDLILSREVTPGSSTSIATNTKEAAYSRRLSQNRRAQRAHRARQRQRVESLEEQLKTVISEYKDLQQRYSALSALYERLAKDEESKETEKNHEQQVKFERNWRSEPGHVIDNSCSRYAFEVDQFIPNTWQQWNDRAEFPSYCARSGSRN